MNFDDAMNQVDPPVPPEEAWQAPKGWEPGITWSNEKGTGSITTGPLQEEPDQDLWDRILTDFGLSNDELEIVDGSISLIGWESPIKGATADDGEKTIRLTRYKVTLRRKVKSNGELDRLDVDELCEYALTGALAHPLVYNEQELGMVISLSDWQMGKGEGGGSITTFYRIMQSMADTLHHLDALADVDKEPDAVYLMGMGDMVEQCFGHYPSQSFTIDLNRREQMRITRRLILRFVDELVERDYRVVLGAVPGNHGENREQGKAITTVDDNDDLAVFEQVAEVLDANPGRYNGVTTYLSKEIAYTLDVAGIPVGFFHGHNTSGGASPAAKIEKWWTGQVMGQQNTVRTAKILVTGHYHHFLCTETTGRTHFQSPAMDGGSEWWTSKTGSESPAGMLSFLVSKDYGSRGWGDLLIA